MAEEQAWLLVEHVAVQRGYLDPVASQRPDNGIDLVGRQNEVAGNRRLAAAGGLETDRLGDPHRADRGELHAAFADRIAARYGELVDAAIVLALDADDLVELRRVEIDRRRRSARRCSERGLAGGKCIANDGGQF